LGATRSEALEAMRQQTGAFSHPLLEVMTRVKPMGVDAPARSIVIAELKEGMILGQAVRTKNGTLIVASGHRVTASLVERLRNYHHMRGVEEPIRVLIPGPPPKGLCAMLSPYPTLISPIRTSVNFCRCPCLRR
jgi:hypothetical protein